MIIIAAKGNELSEQLVESIKQFTPDEKYKVVDSEKNGGGYFIKSFETGIDDSDEFMFMHDSMIVKDIEWLNRFRDNDTGGIVAHSYFPMQFDNQEQEIYSKGIVDNGEVGIFGGIFYAKKQIVDIIKPYLKNHPTDVMQSRAWERIMGGICKKHSIPINTVYGEFNYSDVFNDALPGLKKLFLLRQ